MQSHTLLNPIGLTAVRPLPGLAATLWRGSTRAPRVVACAPQATFFSHLQRHISEWIVACGRRKVVSVWYCGINPHVKH